MVEKGVGFYMVTKKKDYKTSVVGYCVLPCRVEELSTMSKKEFLMICEKYYMDNAGSTVKSFITEHSRVKYEFKKGIRREFLPENVSTGMLGIVSEHFKVDKVSNLTNDKIPEAILVINYMYHHLVPVFRGLKISYHEDRLGNKSCSIQKIYNDSKELAVSKGVSPSYGVGATKIVTSLVGSKAIVKEYPYSVCMRLIDKVLEIIKNMESLNLGSNRIG